MADKPGERFAKLTIAELADIHAVVLTLADFAIADLSLKSGITLTEAKALFESKRKPRAKRLCDDLLKRLRLPS